jgi:hypothetical protein
MREKVRVLGRKNRLPQDVGDVLVLDDFPVFSSQFDERVAIRVVNVAGGGRLKLKEGGQIGQVCAVKSNVSHPAQDQQKWDGYQRHSNAGPGSFLASSPQAQ